MLGLRTSRGARGEPAASSFGSTQPSGANPGAVATALCIDGEDEVAVRGGVLYTARLEHLDLRCRCGRRPIHTSSCVAWTAEHAWVCLSPPPPRRVRIERVVTFGADLAVSVAFDPDTRERRRRRHRRGARHRGSRRPVHVLAYRNGGYPFPTRRGCRAHCRASSPSRPCGRSCLGRLFAHVVGVHASTRRAPPARALVHAWVVSTPNELQAAPLHHSADVGVVGVVSSSGDEPPRWSALPNGWAVRRRLRPAALHAKDLVENLPAGDVETPIATRPFLELATSIESTPQAFDVSHHHIDALDMRTLRVNPDDTWWITGGTRGFGFAIAVWLLEHGAKRLVLSSRTGRMRDDDRARFAAKDARVEVCALDVGDSDAVKAFVANT